MCWGAGRRREVAPGDGLAVQVREGVGHEGLEGSTSGPRGVYQVLLLQNSINFERARSRLYRNQILQEI